MKTIKNLGALFLSFFLILAGVRGLFSLAFAHLNLLVNLCALVGGVLILWSVLSGWSGKQAA